MYILSKASDKKNRLIFFKLISMLIVVSFCLIFSCTPKKEQPSRSANPSLNDLYQAWYTQTTLQKENIDFQTALTISSQMISLYGEEGINKIFNVLANPQEKPLGKYLAVMSLTPYVKENWVDRLRPLTEPDKEVNTRVCALALLSLIQTPEVTAHLKKMINDPEPRVQFEVLTALAKRGEPEGIQQIGKLWDSSIDSPEKREHIILSIPPAEVQKFLPLFREAAKDEQIAPTIRRDAITQIGRYGKHQEDIDTLKSIVDKEIQSDLKELAQSALDAVNARFQNSPSSQGAS